MEQTVRLANRAGRGERGAALILALAMLALMTVMGTYYVRFMSNELDAAQFDEARLRARLAAESGIEAALAELTRARDQGQTHFVTGEQHRYTLPVYRFMAGGSGRGFDEDANRSMEAVVTIEDENSKINLNTAPAPVIAAALGVDLEIAQAIVASQPRQTEVRAASLRPANAEGKELRWLHTLDDLRDGELLSPEQFAAMDTALVTTFSALPFTDDTGTLNVNTAPAPVLTAALGLTAESSAQLIEYRRNKPFRDPVGVQVITFRKAENFPLNLESAKGEALAVSSRVFRLVSEGAYVHVGTGGEPRQRAYARAEAVVRFHDDGTASIIYWNTGRTRNPRNSGAA
jgi:type II secretory pathway component PulK